MKKFMVLYQSTDRAANLMEGASPEQVKASMDAWMDWKDSVGANLIDLGMPLEAGKRIENGSVTDGTSTVSGYSIVEAEDLDGAAKLLENHPQLKVAGMSIEILEFLPVPGM